MSFFIAHFSTNFLQESSKALKIYKELNLEIPNKSVLEQSLNAKVKKEIDNNDSSNIENIGIICENLEMIKE